MPLRPPDFDFDREELERAFAAGRQGDRALQPGQPHRQGVHARRARDTIVALAEKHDAFIITDEPYEHMVYEPHEHTYVHALPGAFERTIVCNSLSKTYSITGWRIGYVLGSPDVIRAARKVHDFLTIGAAAPLQEAAVTALEFPPQYYTDLRDFYAGQRDLFLGYLRQTGLAFTEPQGAYYVMVDISPLGFANDGEASDWFIKEIGVAGVAGSSFFREPVHDYIRFHFAKSAETLHAAGERLLQVASRAALTQATEVKITAPGRPHRRVVRPAHPCVPSALGGERRLHALAEALRDRRPISVSVATHSAFRNADRAHLLAVLGQPRLHARDRAAAPRRCSPS